jgi:hypothetical protein
VRSGEYQTYGQESVVRHHEIPDDEEVEEEHELAPPVLGTWRGEQQQMNRHERYGEQQDRPAPLTPSRDPVGLTAQQQEQRQTEYGELDQIHEEPQVVRVAQPERRIAGEIAEERPHITDERGRRPALVVLLDEVLQR